MDNTGHAKLAGHAEACQRRSRVCAKLHFVEGVGDNAGKPKQGRLEIPAHEQPGTGSRQGCRAGHFL